MTTKTTERATADGTDLTIHAVKEREAAELRALLAAQDKRASEISSIDAAYAAGELTRARYELVREHAASGIGLSHEHTAEYDRLAREAEQAKQAGEGAGSITGGPIGSYGEPEAPKDPYAVDMGVQVMGEPDEVEGAAIRDLFEKLSERRQKIIAASGAEREALIAEPVSA